VGGEQGKQRLTHSWHSQDGLIFEETAGCGGDGRRGCTDTHEGKEHQKSDRFSGGTPPRGFHVKKRK